MVSERLYTGFSVRDGQAKRQTAVSYAGFSAGAIRQAVQPRSPNTFVLVYGVGEGQSRDQTAVSWHSSY